MDYKAVASVFLGAGLGGVLRYYVSVLAARHWPDFPVGTLIANLAGCFAMGALLAILNREPNEYMRLFVGVGLLGGFTTFSAFSGESLLMIQRGQIGQAFGYMAMSLGGSVMATWLGFILTSNRG